MAKGRIVLLVVLSIMILSLIQMKPLVLAAHTGSPIDSGWASTSPVIDGNITTAEWASATVVNFALQMRSRIDGNLNRTLEGRLYVENNWTYAFLAVQIFNDDYEAHNFGGHYKGLALLFNDNNNGTLVFGDNGEGVTSWTGSPFYSHNDLYYAGSYWDSDFDAGKTEDGSLKWSHTNQTQGAMGNWTFEMMIPLVGTDAGYDFNITSLPYTVGYKIWFEEPANGWDGVYPYDPTISKSFDQTTNASTYGDMTFYPLYNLTMVAGTGGTTTPAPGISQYPYKTVVNATATAYPGYEFDHWELDSVNVGSGNPYSVLMNQNHLLNATFVVQLSVTISPADSTVPLGGSVIFTSNVTGGTPAYSYQWYLGPNLVPGATSPSWTFTPAASGIYYVYLNVTDSKGRVAISNTARVTVLPRPVGGYSISLEKSTPAGPFACYVAFIAAFGAVISFIKRQKKRETRTA